VRGARRHPYWIICVLAAVLVGAAAHGRDYRLIMFTTPNGLLFPTDSTGAPTPGVQPLGRIAFAPDCALGNILDSFHCTGIEKRFAGLREGDTLIVSRDAVFDEICSRAYVLHCEWDSAGTSDELVWALRAQACVDSVDDSMRRVNVVPSGRPGALPPVTIALPDTSAHGKVTVALDISPWGTVRAASIASSDLPESDNQVILDALKAMRIQPVRDGCVRQAVTVYTSFTFAGGYNE
jgi:hypothetical protein